MKDNRYKKIKERRIKLGLTAKEVVKTINPMRIKRGAKPMVVSTYYKKENGEIPIFLEEVDEIAKALFTDSKFFYS